MEREYNRQRPQPERPVKRVQDLPGCIKYILLLFLILLLLAEIYAGEFARINERGAWIIWLILLIKLILIIGLIILIWVQKNLKCQIDEPIYCATPIYDAVLDKWLIIVRGTASGAVFGGYTLSVQQLGVDVGMPVIYPGGGSSGTAPVVNNELGRLDIAGFDAELYTVKLTVYPAGAGSARTCERDFQIQQKTVWIHHIGGVEAHAIGQHPDAPSAPPEVLKLVKLNPASSEPEASLASGITVLGGADVKGCGREMTEYVLQHREVPHPHNPWRQEDTTGIWTNILSPLPYGDATHPRTYSSFWSLTNPNYVRDGVLTRIWVLRDIVQAFLPPPAPPIEAPRNVTDPSAWDTSALNGRFTVRLVVTHQPEVGPPDPGPPQFFDAATVWLDNRPIDGKITSLGISTGDPLGACEELLLSQFITPALFTSPPSPGPFSKVDATINGRAWDPLILDSYPNNLRPNDNFGSYRLQFKKNGDPTWKPIATSTTRVPSALQATPLDPLPLDTGVLTNWDIVAALDAGPNPGDGTPPDYPKIYRGERCAYLIELYVHDTTRIGDSGTPHQVWDLWPFCIMNDLPDDLELTEP